MRNAELVQFALGSMRWESCGGNFAELSSVPSGAKFGAASGTSCRHHYSQPPFSICRAAFGLWLRVRSSEARDSRMQRSHLAEPEIFRDARSHRANPIAVARTQSRSGPCCTRRELSAC